MARLLSMAYLTAASLTPPEAVHLAAKLGYDAIGVRIMDLVNKTGLSQPAIASIVGALFSFITPFRFWQAFLMSLIACVSGSMGHLVMKALKRDRGIPNWGRRGVAVTGANGLLDRVDALCFAAPVFFQAVRWYFDV